MHAGAALVGPGMWLPEQRSILEHDAMLWLGDLNYRLAMQASTLPGVGCGKVGGRLCGMCLRHGQGEGAATCTHGVQTLKHAAYVNPATTAAASWHM